MTAFEAAPEFRAFLTILSQPMGIPAGRLAPMRIDAPTIQPVATLRAASPSPAPAAGAAARIVPVAAMVLTITAVLLVCGLAVVLNLS